MNFPVVLVVKNTPASAGDIGNMGSLFGSGRSPGGGHGNPLQYSCLENPHGQRSMAGYSPLGCNESNTTEATWHAQMHTCVCVCVCVCVSEPLCRIVEIKHNIVNQLYFNTVFKINK